MTDLAKAVGFEFPDTPVSWNKRDLLLYAAGIGSKADELQFVYEINADFAAFPTYPVVLPLKGTGTDVVVFGGGVSVPVPGLPKFDLKRIVHGSQSIQILKALPLVGGEGWRLKRRIASVTENKSGIIVDQEVALVDPRGETYVKMFSSSFNVGAKASGQKFHKSIATAPTGKPIPQRAPDNTFTEATSPESAIIYRLSGDYNPLHIEPSIGKGAGFGGVIIHGLATYGFAARAVLKFVGGNDPSALKYFSVRFTSPVKPGDKIETSMWEVGSGPDGTVEVAFVTKNLNTGKVALGNGTAFVVKKSTKSQSKL